MLGKGADSASKYSQLIANRQNIEKVMMIIEEFCGRNIWSCLNLIYVVFYIRCLWCQKYPSYGLRYFILVSVFIFSSILELYSSFGKYCPILKFAKVLLLSLQSPTETTTAVHFNTYKGTHLRFVYQDIAYRVETIFLISEFCDIHHVLNFRNIWLLCMAGFRTQLLNTGKLEERNT